MCVSDYVAKVVEGLDCGVRDHRFESHQLPPRKGLLPVWDPSQERLSLVFYPILPMWESF